MQKWIRLARTRRFVIGALSIWLAACGGGGGGDPTPDVKLVERTPSSGAADADPHAAVTASFNTSLRASTVNAGTFVLTLGGVEVPGPVGYDEASHEVSLTPEQPLDFLTTYHASLREGIETTDGRPVPPTSWPFTTRDGQWGERQDFPQGDETLQRSSGVNMAALPNSTYRPTASFWDGSAWSTPEPVSSGWAEPEDVATDVDTYQWAARQEADGHIQMVFKRQEQLLA